MAEKDNSNELHSKSTLQSCAGRPQQQHRQCRKQHVEDPEYELLFGKFMEDMEMAIKMFRLKTRMRRLRKKRLKNKTRTPLDSTSSDSDDGSSVEHREEVATIEKPSTRPIRYAREYSAFDSERKQLSPFYNEDAEIGSATLGRVRMLRLVLQDDLDARLDEITTREEYAASTTSQSILGHMGQIHRQTWRNNDDFGGGDYEYYDDDDDEEEDEDDNDSTSSSSYSSTQSSPDENVTPCVAKSSSAEEKSINTELENTCLSVEQDVFRYFHNEFNKCTNVTRPSKSMPAIQNDLQIFDNYLRDLSNELEEYLQWAKFSIEDRKPTLRVAIHTQLEAEQVTVSAKNDLPHTRDEFDEDIEVTNLETEFNRVTLGNVKPTELQPVEESAVSNQDIPADGKRKRIRCAQCNKKLHITNIYECRCGKIFCSQHRYSECHDCTYDYKAEGRKTIEQENPVVTKPKINKF